MIHKNKIYTARLLIYLKNDFYKTSSKELLNDLFLIDESFFTDFSKNTNIQIRKIIRQFKKMNPNLLYKLDKYLLSDKKQSNIKSISLIISIYMINKYKNNYCKVKKLISIMDQQMDKFEITYQSKYYQNLVDYYHRIMGQIVNYTDFFVCYDEKGFNLNLKYLATDKEDFYTDSVEKIIDCIQVRKYFSPELEKEYKVFINIKKTLKTKENFITALKKYVLLREIKKYFEDNKINNPKKNILDYIFNDIKNIDSQEKYRSIREKDIIINVRISLGNGKLKLLPNINILLSILENTHYLILWELAISINKVKVFSEKDDKLFNKYIEELNEIHKILNDMFRPSLTGDKKKTQALIDNHYLSFILKSSVQEIDNGSNLFLLDYAIALVNGFTFRYFIESSTEKDFDIFIKTLAIINVDNIFIEKYQIINKKRKYSYMIPYIFLAHYFNINFDTIKKLHEKVYINLQYGREDLDKRLFGELTFNELFDASMYAFNLLISLNTNKL